MIVHAVMRMVVVGMVLQVLLATGGRRRALRRHGHLLAGLRALLAGLLLLLLLLLLRQHRRHFRLLLGLLLEVHLGVALLLVAAGELAAADVAREGLLAGVGADVGGQVVGARERAHADAALERLLAGVDADVAGELVGAREAPVAVLDRAAVRPLVDGRLAGPVRVLARLDRNQFEGQRRLLVRLLQDLVALAGRRVVLGQLHVAGRPAARRRLDVDDVDAAAGHRRGVARLLLRHHDAGWAGHAEGRGGRIVGRRVDPLVLGHRRALHETGADAGVQQVVRDAAGGVRGGLLWRYVVVAAVDIEAKQFDLLLRSVVVGLRRLLLRRLGLLLGGGRRRTRAGGWVRLVGLGGGLWRLLRQQAEQRREQVLLEPRAGVARVGRIGRWQAGAAHLHRV